MLGYLDYGKKIGDFFYFAIEGSFLNFSYEFRLSAVFLW